MQYAIRLLIPPGSMLLARPTIQPFLGPLDHASLSYRWAHPDARMDRLHRAVSALLEEAARTEEDPAVTFFRLRDLAETMAGRASKNGRTREVATRRRRPPRLTEPWFC